MNILDAIKKALNSEELDKVLDKLPVEKLQKALDNISSASQSAPDKKTQRDLESGKIPDDKLEVYKRLAILAASDIKDITSKYGISKKAIYTALKNTNSVVTDFIVDQSVEISKIVSKSGGAYNIAINTGVKGLNAISELFDDIVSDTINSRIDIQHSMDAIAEELGNDVYDIYDKLSDDIIDGKPIKPTISSKRLRRRVTHKRITKAGTPRVRRTKSGERIPDALGLKALINATIEPVLRNPMYGFMQSSSAPSNKQYLRYQSGRFAKSIKVTSVRNTKPGSVIDIKYDNAGFPYDKVYKPGGWLYTAKGRDITYIATNAIRRIAVDALSEKFGGIKIRIKEN